MNFVWFLVIILGIILVVAFMLVITQVFSEEKELLNEAEDRLADGEKEEAASLLSRVLDRNPANKEARWMMGKMMEFMGNYQQAARHYKFCVENQALPGRVGEDTARARLARVQKKAGQRRAAVENWSRVLENRPDQMKPYMERGKIFYQLEEYERALNDFNKAYSDFDDAPGKVILYRARSYYGLGALDRALKCYREYIEEAPEDVEAALEAAWVAEEDEDISEAKALYNYVREEGDSLHFTRATLALIRLSIQQGQAGDAEENIQELDEMSDRGQIPEPYRLNYLYMKAKFNELIEKRSEALQIYRRIYQEKPDFKDVEQILEDEISKMDEEDLINQYLHMDREEFSRVAERIVELMGYEVVNIDAFGPDEINVAAHDDSEMFKVNRVLFTFKRWNQSVAEWPLKEFELELLEKRFDKGVFVSPLDFRPSALDYAEQTEIELVGPNELLDYLQEAFKV
ncbi:MAG: tetratricopeptide repeat protein [bacterium]